LKKTLRLIIIFVLILQTAHLASCKQAGEPRVFADNDKMSAETRAELDKITGAFEKALSDTDVTEIMKLKDESFSASESELKMYFEDRKEQNKNPFVKYDEYYIKNIKVSDELVRVYKDNTSESYIEIYPKNSEIYITMYASDNEKISGMVTLIAAKTENSWKIMWIDISDYKYNGKSAQDYHKLAKDLFGEGKVLPAYIYAEMMFNIIQPGRILKYADFDDMKTTYEEIGQEFSNTLTLPLSFPELPNVKIYVVGLGNDEEKGVIPLVTYRTDTPISDEAARIAEGKRIIELLGEKYTGFRYEFAFVTLNATNDDLETAGENFKTATAVLPTK
jgi:hypothetical protein